MMEVVLCIRQLNHHATDCRSCVGWSNRKTKEHSPLSPCAPWPVKMQFLLFVSIVRLCFVGLLCSLE